MKLNFIKCKTLGVHNKRADEFITESLDNVMSKIEMPADLYARIESMIPPENHNSDVKQPYSGADIIKPFRRPIPQFAFRFASIIISLLLLCNIYNDLVKPQDCNMQFLLLEER